MVDLDELKRLAEGATPGEWEARQRDWGYPERDGGEVRRLWEIDAGGVNIAGLTIFSLDERDAAYIAAMNPDTAKKLIAVARAGEKALEFFTTYSMLNESGQDEMAFQKTATLDELRTALEELK